MAEVVEEVERPPGGESQLAPVEPAPTASTEDTKRRSGAARRSGVNPETGQFNEAIDLMPPSTSVINHLDNVLKGQFGEMDELALAEEASNRPTTPGSKPGDSQETKISPEANQVEGTLSGAPKKPRFSAVNDELQQSASSTMCTRIVENKFFTMFFMFLTFYALFVPDLDLLLGNKTSKLVFGIISSLVVLAFIVEVVCQCIARKKYFLRAYFWLDCVALISLLPDTWLVQHMFTSNAFVAGRSSRLTRLIRVASRSSKATRLNRLTRIVRVAALMPRVGSLLGRRIKDDDTDKVLEKKLRRVFMFLDEDMDGLIPRSAVMSCSRKMKQEKEPETAGKKLWKVATITNVFSKKKLDASSSIANSSPTSQRSIATSDKADEEYRSESQATESATPGRKKTGDFSESGDSAAKTLKSGQSGPIEVGSSKRRLGDRLMTTISATVNKAKVERGATGTSGSWVDKDDEFPIADDTDMVTFEEFRKMMMEDEIVCSKLRRACQQQLRQGNNMKNLTSRHSEYIAVKVALGVLLLLFVLGWVEPDVQDLSAERGLNHITELVKLKYANDTGQIPPLIHGQVQVWTNGVGINPEKREVLYLDLQKKVYCNEISGGTKCENFGGNYNWTLRTSWKAVEDMVADSDYRRADMQPFIIPDISTDGMEDDELQEKIESVCVLMVRGSTQWEAVMSIMTTILVIIIILSGIILLTKDLTFLSRNLLKPLRELADDMESIAQLQLAGVSSTEDSIIEEGTSEVRLIRRTFENMKKAIKSWGKYVPWPVVQLLLRANVEANLEVNEIEVTIFFSDIASFTTIVESMPPESSLLLLSRYFNDMSKVIDDHGGVVLEFIGDAILCIYGAPLINNDHPTAAVKAALRMLASLRRMNEWSVMRELPEVKIRCGVHTGRVLVGNMGFHSRMKYGIVGEDAHIPSRLEEINKTYGTNMMISNATWSRLPPNVFITRPADYVHLRQTPGCSSEPIHVVMDREKKHGKTHPMWGPCAVHIEAMDLYRSGQFRSAAEKFQSVGRMIKDITDNEDEASALMLKRCNSYIEQPPSAEWDGVWDRGGT